VTIAGVVVDSVETNAQLVRDAELDYQILSDPDFRLIDAYGLRHREAHDGHDIALSASVLVDGKGIVRWTYVTSNVRFRPTASDVLAAVDRLP
jgi:peroxiredoxin